MAAPNYAEVVRSQGWDVYDISRFEERPAPGWDTLQRQGPAVAALDGGTYILAPQHSDEMTLQEAYALTGGVGPHVRIRDANASEYAGLRLTNSPRHAFFSRLQVGFKAPEGQGDPSVRYLRLFAHSRALPSELMDMVLVDVRLAPDVFARDFGVMQPPEWQAEFDRWH